MDTTLQLVQRALIALGYNLGPSGADGDLGRYTIGAVTQFQIDRKLPIKYPGTIGPTTLAALGISQPVVEMLPPWILEAKKYLGLNEVKDANILDPALHLDASVTAWCGAFVNMTIAATLPHEPLLSAPLWALNWQKFGVSVPIDKPVMGAIGVKSRDGGGHVFFIVGHDKTYFHALGGNQSNSVSIVKILKSDVLALRFPSTYPMPAKPLGFTVFNGKISSSEA